MEHHLERSVILTDFNPPHPINASYSILSTLQGMSITGKLPQS